jgi:deoxycytidylate deaminase
MKHQELFDLACKVSNLSTCSRRKVGCVLRVDHNIVTAANTSPNFHLCYRENSKPGDDLNKCPAIHAEALAIAIAASRGFKTERGILYTSNIIPCKDCANLIVAAGIRRVVCGEFIFYDELSKAIFLNSGVELTDMEGAIL